MRLMGHTDVRAAVGLSGLGCSKEEAPTEEKDGGDKGVAAEVELGVPRGHGDGRQ